MFFACEQALCGTLAAGWEKERACATMSLEFEYLHKKVDEKCWLTEMTLVMMSLPLARVFNVCLHSHLFPLRADWLKSDSSVNGKPQRNWRWNSNSRDVLASSPSYSCPTARAPTRAFLQANVLSLQASFLGGYGGPKIACSQAMMSFLFLSTYQDVQK